MISNATNKTNICITLYIVYCEQLHQVNGSGPSKNTSGRFVSFTRPLRKIKSEILFGANVNAM